MERRFPRHSESPERGIDMRIGIFGGTFDPIHMGHLMVAEQAREAAGLDEVWFIPAGKPPHKGTPASPPHHRVRKVELAIADHPHFRLSRVELTRPGPSYTVDTVKDLKKAHPKEHFFLIVGGDMVNDLPRWCKIEEILQAVQVIGHLRPGVATGDLPPRIAERLILLEGVVTIDLSSSEIRKRVADGKSIRYLVPEKVRRYIEENRLYELES
jgi:nicotinate-nucleotide adenylyltransferase